MDLKVMLATFGMIFLAELADKSNRPPLLKRPYFLSFSRRAVS